MTIKTYRNSSMGVALAALTIAMSSAVITTPAFAQPAARTVKPSTKLQLSIGEGQMVNLSQPVTDVWVSNPAVADVHVTNARQINLFGKEFGEATVIATSANGSVVYSASIRVAQNINSIDAMLREAMPGVDVSVKTVGQLAVLNGTVASPQESAQAETLVRALLNPGVNTSDAGAALKIGTLNRLVVATPLQVTLKVRIAEVSRSLVRQIGVNVLGKDSNPGGTFFGIGRGNPGELGNGQTGEGRSFNLSPSATTVGLAGKLFGLDLMGTLDLAEGDGLVTTLAEPSLTALSGETASFLAGGEYPIPVSQGDGAVSIEYKSYGVGLAFTPVVLSDGRISMRVRPEVSELSNEGSVSIGGNTVPALTTRRAETTVELGSGQSFMIAGLLRNANTNNVDKAPFLGDLPILGNLFRSTKYRRSETELVIVVTPYLVRPTSKHLALPTDGYRAPNAGELVFGGHTYKRRPLSQTATTPAGADAAKPGFKF